MQTTWGTWSQTVTTGNIWGEPYEKLHIQVGSLDDLVADAHRKIRETLYKQSLCILYAVRLNNDGGFYRVNI